MQRSLALAVTFATVLFLAACGGGSDDAVSGCHRDDASAGSSGLSGVAGGSGSATHAGPLSGVAGSGCP